MEIDELLKLAEECALYAKDHGQNELCPESAENMALAGMCLANVAMARMMAERGIVVPQEMSQLESGMTPDGPIMVQVEYMMKKIEQTLAAVDKLAIKVDKVILSVAAVRSRLQIMDEARVK